MPFEEMLLIDDSVTRQSEKHGDSEVLQVGVKNQESGGGVRDP